MPQKRQQFSVFADIESDDKCTLVSIVPFLVNEFKPGIYPGRFVIPPCRDYKKPELLEVGTSIYFIPQFNGDEELPAHIVKNPSRDIAKSIVEDYMRAQMDVDDNCHPGLAWLPGKVTQGDLTKHVSMLLALQKSQLAWFGKLVQRADNDWNRYKRHTVVSDNQRFAARALGMEKDWLTPTEAEVPVKCPACLTNCSPLAVVCANCRCILDVERHKKLTFAA